MPTSRSVGAVARLAASQHGVVTRSQAAAHEIDRRGVRSLIERGFWHEPIRGIYVVTSSPQTWHQRVALATFALGGVPVASHPTGGRLHVLDGFLDDPRVEVTVPRGARIGLEGVVVHRCVDPVLPMDRVVVDGLPVTGLARTLVDLAGTEHRSAIERALDDFERRGHSLGWLESTAQRLHRPGQRGTGVVLAEVARRRTRGQVRGSWFQKLVAECLRSPLIPGLVEEYEICDAAGRFVARVDLAVPVVKLGIEAHSRRYHTGAAAEAYDEHRDNLVAEQGWDLRYVGYWAATRTPAQVRDYIERLVARRARDLGVVLPRK